MFPRFPSLLLRRMFVAMVSVATLAAPGAAMTGKVDGEGMVRLPAGEFRPLYGRPGDPPSRVAAFRLDRDAVTRGEFLAFVRANPRWRRGAMSGSSPAGVQAHYLRDWASDLDAGSQDPRLPVTWVSRSAARAYCEARGKRLPTLDEWEYAAAASESKRDASKDAGFRDGLVANYARRGLGLQPVLATARNAWGARGLHDNVWEWVEDPHRGHEGHGGPGASKGVSQGVATAADQTCASASIGARDPADYAAFLRSAMRAGLDERSALGSLGFRCAS